MTPDAMTPDEELAGCLEINRAFHGWGHQFLYNRGTLGLALRAAGFARIDERAYGESAVDDLRGLERHERHRDLPGAPSVLVVEAAGMAEPRGDFEERAAPYLRDFATK